MIYFEPYEDEHRWIIVAANPDFVDYIVPKGFPIVLDAETRRICEPIFLFMHQTYVTEAGGDTADLTLLSYTQDLKDWMQSLEEVELDWKEAKVSDLVRYVTVMKKTVVPITGAKYAAATINRRSTVVQLFYEWGSKYFLPAVPTDDHLLLKNINEEERRKRRIKARVRDNNEDVVTRILNQSQASDLMKALGPNPIERLGKEGDNGISTRIASTSRDRLASEIALKVGLRLAEICSLRLTQFDRFLKCAIEPLKTYNVTVVGKGKKSRVAKFSGELLISIVAYIQGERQEIVSECREVGISKGALILNPKSSGQHVGKPLHRRTLERAFSDAVVRCGFTHVEQRTRFVRSSDGKLKGNFENVNAPNFVVHDLRHTFAVWLYYTLKRSGDVAPWLTVQARLGHVFVSTTMDIYLRAAADFEAEVTDRFIAHNNGQI